MKPQNSGKNICNDEALANLMEVSYTQIKVYSTDNLEKIPPNAGFDSNCQQHFFNILLSHQVKIVMQIKPRSLQKNFFHFKLVINF